MRVAMMPEQPHVMVLSERLEPLTTASYPLSPYHHSDHSNSSTLCRPYPEQRRLCESARESIVPHRK
jgi:hypothetical protein